ncbi:hypothetical protein ACTXT7_001453 [Hymenolepis weldensis]
MCQLVFVQVNGVEVVGSSHEEAAILLKTASYRVDLVLAYCPAEYKKLEEQVRAQTEGQSDNREDEQGERCKTEGIGPHIRHSIEADGLFVRVLADFDPHEVMEVNQVIPRDAISIRSGDILQLLNVSDREWWQVQQSQIYNLASLDSTKETSFISTSSLEVNLCPIQ